ncbi:hypothetical protein L3X38_038270 [Prunus dulcis]|uniref:SWIM-type domain-containing protein n=1 Tax=Prunus dulcis TaxID=3755 RepID=A0AAD4YQB3_PRUDU|nr:hypothetical protein L3X38_038270 [Prunus dulcis]
MMRSRVVCSLFMDIIHAKPELKPVEIIREFKDYYDIDISYYHALFGKELAKLDVHGDESKSFNELVWYADAVKETNTGPSTRGSFSMLPERMGIKFYPLAFGVVDSETEENWTWFLQHLAAILLPIGRVVTFFSNRNQGLLNAMGFVFPGWPHFHCYYHLKLNLISKYPKSGYGKLLQHRVINLFGRCAYAVTKEEFKVAMDELVIVGSSKVKTIIYDLSRDHYVNAFFKGMHYGEMENSLAESLNNWVGVFRDLPVLPLIEGIRQKLMVLNSQRRIEAEKWTTILCPKMETRLWENAEAGRTWAVRRSRCTVFEVFADYSVMVDLEQRTCSYRLWQIDGFPCTHAVSAILAKKDSVYDYVE